MLLVTPLMALVQSELKEDKELKSRLLVSFPENPYTNPCKLVLRPLIAWSPLEEVKDN